MGKPKKKLEKVKIPRTNVQKDKTNVTISLKDIEDVHELIKEACKDLSKVGTILGNQRKGK